VDPFHPTWFSTLYNDSQSTKCRSVFCCVAGLLRQREIGRAIRDYESLGCGPFWPPAGIAMAAVFLKEESAAGTFRRGVSCESAGRRADSVSLCVALGNTLEAVAGVALGQICQWNERFLPSAKRA
jgi:hypothetical protein